MSVQILGLREYFDSRIGKQKKKEVFFDRGWRASSVAQIFAENEAFVAQIPDNERYNLYYTVAECLEEPGRKILRQTVIPFDIDGIDVAKAEDVARVVCETLGIAWDKTGIVFSGNGVQLLVDQPHLELTADEHFESMRVFYKGCIARINLAMMEAGLEGAGDPAVWSPARLMRLPGTENRKPNKTTRMATCLQANIAVQDFDLKAASGIVDVAPRDQIAQSVVNRLPKPDSNAVQAECEFLKWAKANQNDVREQQWYGMLSIVGRLDNGLELAHEYSREHKGYSAGETELKVEQALANSGPRTCSNIESMWEGCKGCKHYQSEKVRSPIMIQGPDYILTENSGFHSVITDQNGNKKPGKPQVEDLRRYFQRKMQYVTMVDSKMVYVWNGTHWVEMENAELESFAYENFFPKVGSNVRNEFIKAVQCTNLRPAEWFQGSTDRRINFANGVFSIDTGALEPHTPAYGFRYVLPYAFDPRAESPIFDSFLRDVTLGRRGLEDVLLEYMGYAFSGDECWEHKALMLLGVGRNGKSTFMQVLEMLAGEGTYATVTLTEMKNETMRQQLDGRLFNMAEETSPTALVDSSIFKNIVGGGQIIVKKLYKQPYTIRNRCKLIFSCNELPLSKDKTDALYRRLLIVPFDNKFDSKQGNVDPLIKLKLQRELPGIFNRVLDGYRRLLEHKQFTNHEALREQLEIYEQANDAVFNFFQDEIKLLDVGPQAPRTPTKDIYQAYRFYSESVYGEKPVAQPHFFSMLRKRIADYDARFVREMETGVRERKLIGVMLANGTGRGI